MEKKKYLMASRYVPREKLTEEDFVISFENLPDVSKHAKLFLWNDEQLKPEDYIFAADLWEREKLPEDEHVKKIFKEMTDHYYEHFAENHDRFAHPHYC